MNYAARKVLCCITHYFHPSQLSYVKGAFFTWKQLPSFDIWSSTLLTLMKLTSLSSVLAATRPATTATRAPRWCTAAARSTAYTHTESSGAYR